jgi:hypothetical protein
MDPGPPCPHTSLLPDSPRPGLSECSECGRYTNAAGNEVASCYDCQSFDDLLDLLACADDHLRCSDCSDDYDLARARERREVQRESAWDMAYEARMERGL